MLEENNYNGAIDKLTNDILKKLDADGQVDWVNRPVLMDKLNAFASILKYRLSQVAGR